VKYRADGEEEQEVMETIHPAIVVVAFNRPRSLKRILDSIRRADYTGYADIPLVISIDQSEDPAVRDVASSTPWDHGPKRVIVHDRHLGLRKHILACGDLSKEYGAVIVLEDDLAVSPAFYDYSVQAVEAYQKEASVGGISLYSYEFNEYADMKFIAVDDGYDNYFVQTVSSWGQIWTGRQWARFKGWYEQNAPRGVRETDLLPLRVTQWPESSWKKYFLKYMVEEDVTFVFPRISLTTGFGDDGVHLRGLGNLLQVPMLMRRKAFRFGQVGESSAVYDAFFEPTQDVLKRACPEFRRYEFECDFYGTKDVSQVTSDYLISSKEAKEAIFRFGDEMVPPVTNVLYGIPGSHYAFAERDHFMPLSRLRRLGIVYRQQRILSGVTAVALGCYRFFVLGRSMLKTMTSKFRGGSGER